MDVRLVSSCAVQGHDEFNEEAAWLRQKFLNEVRRNDESDSNDKDAQYSCDHEIIAGSEHIGSTAVHGMLSKPYVDIVIRANSMDYEKKLRCAMFEIGYKVGVPARTWFHKACSLPSGAKGFIVYVHHYFSRHARQMVAFRDALRSDAVVAGEYARLKADLQGKSFSQYTDAKTAFVVRHSCLSTPKQPGKPCSLADMCPHVQRLKRYNYTQADQDLQHVHSVEHPRSLKCYD
eukprot:1045035-Amphidinium_carterae.1